MTWTLSAFADEAGQAPQEQIDALVEAGLKYIDLRGIGNYNITTLPEPDARALRSQLDAVGITVRMFGSPIGKIDVADDFQADLDRLDHLARMSEVFGCREIRVFSYFNEHASLSPQQWQDESIRRLLALRDRAGQLGLTLYHENERHIFGDTIAQVQAIAGHVCDGQSFKLIFDFDNFNQSGENVWDAWLALRDRVHAFHLKDSTPELVHVPIGQGAGHARDIFADALQRGWQGPLSLEPHLKHSAAVMATGPGGQQNQALQDMTAHECFVFAVAEARQLLDEVGAPVE